MAMIFFEHLKKSELYKTLLERYHLRTTTTNNELTIFFIFFEIYAKFLLTVRQQVRN